MKKNYFFAVCITLLCMSCGTNFRDTKTKDISCFEYSGRPSQALSYKEVVSMLKHYDDTRVEVLKKANKGNNDTRENYFPLEDLKAYIAYVEKLSKTYAVNKRKLLALLLTYYKLMIIKII